jgi:ribulose-phosphate 3-epimerase
MPEAFERLSGLRELLPASTHIQVDGGVKLDNIRAAREAGANLLVAATAVFHDGDVGEAYRGLVAASR